MKKTIVSELDKNTITLIDVETHAYIGIENNRTDNPFRRGLLACVEPGKYQMFFDGFGHINRALNEPDSIENIIKKWQEDKNVVFYHFDKAKELYSWLANE